MACLVMMRCHQNSQTSESLLMELRNTTCRQPGQLRDASQWSIPQIMEHDDQRLHPRQPADRGEQFIPFLAGKNFDIGTMPQLVSHAFRKASRIFFVVITTMIPTEHLPRSGELLQRFNVALADAELQSQLVSGRFPVQFIPKCRGSRVEFAIIAVVRSWSPAPAADFINDRTSDPRGTEAPKGYSLGWNVAICGP
jgi:hypothetical protein